jgi:hypothetical protein
VVQWTDLGKVGAGAPSNVFSKIAVKDRIANSRWLRPEHRPLPEPVRADPLDVPKTPPRAAQPTFKVEPKSSRGSPFMGGGPAGRGQQSRALASATSSWDKPSPTEEPVAAPGADQGTAATTDQAPEDEVSV